MKILILSLIFYFTAQAQLLNLFFDNDRTMGEILTDSLKAYWAMEDASDSYSNNDLTNTGVTFTTGKVNNCGVFASAENDFLSVAHNANLDLAGSVDFTIACWVNLVSVSTMGFITQSETNEEKARVIFYTTPTPDQPIFVVSNDGTTLTTIEPTAVGMTTSTWYFVAIWRNTGTDSIYIQQNN